MKIERCMSNEANGTCLQGYVDVSYDRLVEVFGEPSDGDGYKVDAEWVLKIDGIICTIYNYKDGKNYLGSDGMTVKDIRDWYIGGFNKDAVTKVQEALS